MRIWTRYSIESFEKEKLFQLDRHPSVLEEGQNGFRIVEVMNYVLGKDDDVFKIDHHRLERDGGKDNINRTLE